MGGGKKSGKLQSARGDFLIWEMCSEAKEKINEEFLLSFFKLLYIITWNLFKKQFQRGVELHALTSMQPKIRQKCKIPFKKSFWSSE